MKGKTRRGETQRGIQPCGFVFTTRPFPKCLTSHSTTEANTQEQAEAKFRLFMLSLFSGNWSLRWVQELAG
jgi:hypothetical protein